MIFSGTLSSYAPTSSYFLYSSDDVLISHLNNYPEAFQARKEVVS